MKSHYLQMEVDGIQRFVFASPKLKIVRGGSAMLDRFNRVQMPERAKGAEIVFVGGGHCLIRGLSKTDAESIGKDLECELRRRTEGQVTLLWAVTPDDTDWPTARLDLENGIKRRRLEPVPEPPQLPPFIALCSSCGVGPAQEMKNLQDPELKPICGVCGDRMDEMRSGNKLCQQTIWPRLRPHLGRHQHLDSDEAFQRLLPGGEFQVLAELNHSSKQYLAYLYCDGNGMGSALASANTDKEYGEISKQIDGALHEAVAQAIVAHCAPSGKMGTFRADVLMLGGDDLIVALPSDCAIPFTNTVLKEFFRRTDGRFRLSAGLVFAPPTTPIAILQHVASALLKSAKRRAYFDGERQRFNPLSVLRPPAEGYIDFKELSAEQFEIEREQAVTCRPYRLDDFMTLVERIRKVQDCEVPPGRLYALAEAASGSIREAYTITQLVVGRSNPKRGQPAALCELLRPPGLEEATTLSPFVTQADPDEIDELPFDLYPNRRRFAPLPDAIELYDHLGKVPEAP